MKAKILTLILSAVSLIAATAYGQNIADLIGTWHNESKATLTITAISPGGQLTGTYIPLPGASGKIFPVNGRANPGFLALKKDHVVPVIFTLRNAPYGSVTVWAGYLGKGNDGRLFIFTIWNEIDAQADPDASFDPTATYTAIFKPGPVQ